MATITVELNVNKFLENIKKYKNAKLSQIKNEIAVTGEEIVTGAKKLAPVKYNRLRSSLRVLRKRRDGLGLEAGTDVSYAAKMESGIFSHARGKHKGNPTTFLFPAFEKIRPGFEKRIKELLKNIK